MAAVGMCSVLGDTTASHRVQDCIFLGGILLHKKDTILFGSTERMRLTWVVAVDCH